MKMLLKFPEDNVVPLILLLLISLLSSTTNAQYNNVGVRPGDWMTHLLLYQGKNYPTPYPWILNRTILYVDGAWVKLNYTALWTNKTKEERVISGDVSKGAEYISPMLIPSNLGIGDRILLKITEYFELDITFEKEERMEVELELQGIVVERTLVSARFSFGQPPWPLVNVTASWDKETGILVFMFSQHETFNSTCKLIATNAFRTNNNEEPPQLNYQLVVAVVSIIIFGVLVTYAIFKPHRKRNV